MAEKFSRGCGSVPNNPIDRIEQAQSQRELGQFAYRVYSGAREEGASRLEAVLILWAWFLGLTVNPSDEDEDES